MLYTMVSEELVRAMDYILNRCNEQDIEAVAVAVVRRRRDIALFGSMPIASGTSTEAKGRGSPLDPRRLAEEINSQLNIEGNIENLKKSVRDYAIQIIKQQAPDLSDKQIEELTRAWIPAVSDKKQTHCSSADESPSLETTIPRDLLASMINQFVSFSLGRMEEEEDQALRSELGSWPDKYWKAFPQVVCLIIKDFLKGEMDETDFNTRIGLALQIG